MIKYLYCSRRGVQKGDDAYPIPKPHETLLLLAVSPSEAEIKKIVDDFNLEASIVKNYSRASYSKRISLKPYQFVFVDYMTHEGRVLKTKSLFIIEKNVLIIVSQDNKLYPGFFDLISEEIENSRSKSRVSYLLYRILEEDVEENYEVLKAMEIKVNKLEDTMTDEVSGKIKVSPKELIVLKREFFTLNKVFWASSKIVFNLKTGLIPLELEKKDQMILEDVYHTLQHQIEIVFSQKEMLTDLLEIHVSNVSNDLNKVMKTLTALTVVVAVPTFIASAYGMNFKYLPFADLMAPVQGVYVIGLFMAIVSTIFLIYFYRKKWL